MPQMDYVAVEPRGRNTWAKDTCECGRRKMARSRQCWTCQVAWPARFFARIERTATCWNWIGQVDRDGYGIISYRHKNRKAHRVSWEMEHGPIPEGMTLDHLCRNRRCVNPSPDHLEVASSAVNTMRGNGPAAMNARKTHCKRGHEFNEANTYVDSRGRRGCRRCRTKAAKDSKARLLTRLTA